MNTDKGGAGVVHEEHEGARKKEKVFMSVLFILIPLAVLLGGGALGAFLYAVHRGQFDDLETPPERVVFEE
jgi:cbb3-type cytochrome oxidase maturation protein